MLVASCSAKATPTLSSTGDTSSTTPIVKVYTTPSWPWCATLKEFLDKNGIQYQEFNVAEDKEAFNEMMRLSGRNAVPQTVINGEVIIGFNEPALKEKLGIQ